MRKLQPIEIAEGALMADLAVIFQLLTIYLPIVGDFFRLPVFVVFTILVLRRGLYVGIMSLVVACFIVSVTMGPQHVIAMSLEMVGGLFLGITMKHRLRHTLLLLLGVTCGALTLYSLIFFLVVLTGTPLDTLAHSLQRPIEALIVVINALATRIGIGNWWHLNASPVITAVATWGFTYWWIAYYVFLWVFSWAMVLPIYTVTNVLVLSLGYDVRPFPGGKLGWFIQRGRRRIVKLAIKRRLMHTQRAKI